MHNDEHLDREGVHGFDLLVNRCAQALGKRSSRRSMLGRTSGFLLALMGLEQGFLFPTLRQARGDLDPDCTKAGCDEGDAKYCGMQGRPCSTCTSDYDETEFYYNHDIKY
jgi:hypothetical protein